ncbi:MAG TPA: efflux RND transporter periplasmic adaptor subunit [Candidatus Saccharimonadales bacterium]|nr:efflux RND transporter periplasmic adaptor subunit [Candidatus Saccharimonadales bacterium]
MTAKQRSTKSWVWLLLLIVLGGGGWWWYNQRPKESPLDFKATAVARGDITQAVTANGQLSALTNVTVGSQVSGIITDIRVDFNSRVTNGQIVAQIDPETYEQTITQTEAELANAKAGLELAVLNMRRAKELRTGELISAAEYDKTEVELHQADAVVRTREASVRKAKVDRDRTTIYAPIDGVVISRAVDKGQTVAASFNAPVLFNIANDLRHMRIELMVSEADVGGVLEGQRVSFTVDAFFGRQFSGEVTQVRFAPITNQNVVNYTTVVQVNNDDLRLRPGMTANASIITAQRRGVLKVPNAALRFRPPETAQIKGATNGPTGASNRLALAREPSGGGPAGGDGSGSGSGGGGGGERPNREEMRKRMESMTPEQREEFRARMRARFGEGGGPGRSGGSPPADGPATRTVYLLEKDTSSGTEQVVLKPVTVKTGIADASFTEVLDGLTEGDQVVSGVNMPGLPTGPGGMTGRPGGSPFGGPFGGGGPRR